MFYIKRISVDVTMNFSNLYFILANIVLNVFVKLHIALCQFFVNIVDIYL